MGLDVYLKWWDKPRNWEFYADDSMDNDRNFTYIEKPSSKYPDHLFNMGYFRSNYNDYGTNQKLRSIIGLDLYSIFNPPPIDKNYHFQPDWELAKSITQKAIRDLKDYITKGSYGVKKIEEVAANGKAKNSITSEALALQKFQEIVAQHSESQFGNFMSADGHFFLSQPLKVLGVLQGDSRDFLGVPLKCVYVIYEDDSLGWYLQGLEIVEETCDWVLAQPDIDHYCLAWSA